MDEPSFVTGTSSSDRPRTRVRSELAEMGRAIGASLQGKFAEVRDLSATLDSVIRTAVSEGSSVASIAGDVDLSVDLVDYVAHGGTTWEWLLNRALQQAR